MVRIDDSEDVTKCWLDFPEEVEVVEEYARERDWEVEIAVMLMSRVGVRASGVPSIRPDSIDYQDEGDYWSVRVRGKNTKGGEKTERDAYLPQQVKQTLDRYEAERDIEEDEAYVDKHEDTIRRWIYDLASEIAEETGEARWKHVSSHDLRRSWATYNLVERNPPVPVRVMMEIGGWSSYDAIEPYLSKPSTETIGKAMRGEKVGVESLGDVR